MPKAKVIDCDLCGTPFKQSKSRHSRLCSTECRLLSQVEIGGPEDCWLWTGRTNKGGYGRLYHDGSLWVTHRLAYTFWLGAVPEGLVLDHLCRVRNCVNPAHLEPVTDRENVLRGVGPSAVHARKTHCIHGHEFTPENTRILPRGERVCLACHRERGRALWRRRKSA